MLKEMLSKVVKVLAASISILIAAYTVGFSGAIAIHELFKTEKSDAQAYVREQVSIAESRFMSIHRADMDGLNGQLKILIDQNKLIISQNYRTRKVIEERID